MSIKKHNVEDESKSYVVRPDLQVVKNAFVVELTPSLETFQRWARADGLNLSKKEIQAPRD